MQLESRRGKRVALNMEQEGLSDFQEIIEKNATKKKNDKEISQDGYQV